MSPHIRYQCRSKIILYYLAGRRANIPTLYTSGKPSQLPALRKTSDIWDLCWPLLLVAIPVIMSSVKYVYFLSELYQNWF